MLPLVLLGIFLGTLSLLSMYIHAARRDCTTAAPQHGAVQVAGWAGDRGSRTRAVSILFFFIFFPEANLN